MKMGYFSKFRNDGVPFMDGRDKGSSDEILGQPLHMDDFGFINGNDGRFAVMSFVEFPDKFYFGNSVVTEMLETVEADGMKGELVNVTITFDRRKSKNGRDYIAYTIEE